MLNINQEQNNIQINNENSRGFVEMLQEKADNEIYLLFKYSLIGTYYTIVICILWIFISILLPELFQFYGFILMYSPIILWVIVYSLVSLITSLYLSKKKLYKILIITLILYILFQLFALFIFCCSQNENILESNKSNLFLKTIDYLQMKCFKFIQIVKSIIPENIIEFINENQCKICNGIISPCILSLIIHVVFLLKPLIKFINLEIKINNHH